MKRKFSKFIKLKDTIIDLRQDVIHKLNTRIDTANV